MAITSLHVRHVRAHTDRNLRLSPNVTLVTGANGSGKTSLVEALYIALQGRSFKGSDSDVLQRDSPWYRIDVVFDDESKRRVKFDPSRQTGRKQFIVDGKTTYRLPAASKYPVVLFEPDDLRLINGSPVRRRQFIDRFISQLDPQYSQALRRYERALKQRNTLLKQESTSDDLFAWNVSLSEYGAYIIASRLRFIGELNQRLRATYATIAGTNDAVEIRYSGAPHASLKQKLLSELEAHTEKDRLLGFTSVGPHRHDVLFDFNDSPALSVASRGEIRSIILALKFLEIDSIEAMTGHPPVVMLDDVFSELDEHRQKYFADLTTRNQIIITSATHHSSIPVDNITNLDED